MPRVMRSKSEVRDELVKLIEELRIRESYSGEDPNPVSTERIRGAVQALAWVLDAKKTQPPSSGPQSLRGYLYADAQNLRKEIDQATKTKARRQGDGDAPRS